MPEQLESALVILLEDAIPWEAAISITAGTLTPIDPAATLDSNKWQERDRQLAYRDLINAAAVVKVSIQANDVWNNETIRPIMQGAVLQDMQHVPDEAGNLNSVVRHVANSSIPYDALVTDKDLYGRDALIYESLARACSLFNSPPVTSIDSAGTIPNTATWSLAQGQAVRADINPALPINRNFFALPDQNLADRDNQVAGYAAKLIQELKNPFEYADRIYVEIAGPGSRDPEVYALTRDYWQAGTYAAGREVYCLTSYYRALTSTSDVPLGSASWLAIATPSQRVFVCEPALPGRNRIIYDVTAKTLQWFRETANSIHVPQIVALSIPGITVNQQVSTLPQVPDSQDAQYWRSKAALIVPSGGSIYDASYADLTSSAQITGGKMQVSGASMTVPDTVVITLPGSLPAGIQRVSILVKPNPFVEIAGSQNIQGTSGTLGGATYATNVASGQILSGVTYIAENGDGIVYDGVSYAPGSTFTGLAGITTYTGNSDVRQYALTYTLALPIGAWMAQVDYTNLGGTTDGFGVRLNYSPSGGETELIMEDTALLPFTDSNGDSIPNGQVVRSTGAPFDVSGTLPCTLPLLWTYGDGTLHVRQISFTSAVDSARYVMSGTLYSAGVPSPWQGNADIRCIASMPEVLAMDTRTPSMPGPLTFRLACEPGAEMPIQLRHVQVQTLGTFVPTPATESIPGWRWEMLERAGLAVSQSYAEALQAAGTNIPVFRSSGSAWSTESTESWMSFIETAHPRLREIASVPSGSIVVGRQYLVKSGPVTYDGQTYYAGDKFYGTDATTYAGGTVDQIGAFMLAKAGHVGRTALAPTGLEYVTYAGTIHAHYDALSSYPHLSAIQPWMLEYGIYCAQPEFWMPENI